MYSLEENKHLWLLSLLLRALFVLFCFVAVCLLVCFFSRQCLAMQPKLELSNFCCFSLPSTWLTDMHCHIWLQVNDIKNKSWAAWFSPVTTGIKNPESLFLNGSEERTLKLNFYNQKKANFRTKYIKPPFHKRTVIVKENL